MHSIAAILGPSALATKEFWYSTTPENGKYVRIVGRKSGLVDFFLSLIGIDSTTIFEVYRDHIRFKTSNLSGSTTMMIPMSSVSNTASGYFKPFIYFVIGIPLLPVFGLGLIPIIYYFLHKSLMLSVTSHSADLAAIAFKRSVIEGVKVEQGDADKVVEIINKLVLDDSWWRTVIYLFAVLRGGI